MASYIHSTPEILVSRFVSKSQVKNSELCGLIDDNFPDDLFSLRGEQLDIQESGNTINKDLALAIGFNQIVDEESAKQVGKLLIANGPGLDATTIQYYVRRLSNGPYGNAVREHIRENFSALNNSGVDASPGQYNLGNGNKTDKDFISYLRNKLGAADCFLTPANYFEFQGIYATLANTENIWNYTTAPVSDTNGKETRGYELPETTNKMSKPFQMVSIGLNFLTLNIFRKVLKTAKSEQELQEEKALFQAGASERQQNQGQVVTQDTGTAKAYSEGSTDTKSTVVTSKGDNYRVSNDNATVNQRSYANSKTSPGNNATQSTSPVSTPSPSSPTRSPYTEKQLSVGPPEPPITNYSLVPTSFYRGVNSGNPPTSPTWRPNAPTYEEFIAQRSLNGGSPPSFVAVRAHGDLFRVGDNFVLDKVTYTDNAGNTRPVPFRVVETRTVETVSANGVQSSRSIPRERIEVNVNPNDSLDNSITRRGGFGVSPPGAVAPAPTPGFTGATGNIKRLPRNTVAQNCTEFGAEGSGEFNNQYDIKPETGLSPGSALGPNSALNDKWATVPNNKNVCQYFTATQPGYKCTKGVLRILGAVTGNSTFNSYGYDYTAAGKQRYWLGVTNSKGERLYSQMELGNASTAVPPPGGWRNGDVLAYQAGPTNRLPYGHHEVYVNGRWYSDFNQGQNSLDKANGNFYTSQVQFFRMNDLETYSK